MGVLWKARARKAAAGGYVTVGYGNFPVAGLLKNKHVALTIGEYVLRMNYDEAERVFKQVSEYLEKYKNE